ncbi:GNAT family N-acetyltransferase [Streptomyces mirabilis]
MAPATPRHPSPDQRHRFRGLAGCSLADVSRVQRQGEVTYIVHPQVWRQGIGTEIGRQLLSRGFSELGLHRIYATCDPRNTGSSRVLAKLGVTQEGRLRHIQLIRDGWRGSLIFSILEEE